MNVADSQSAESFRIELSKQQIVTLAKLPRHAPKRRGDKPMHTSTAFRMAKDGCRRKSDGTIIKLPTIYVCGTKCTSLEAFQWFSEQLSSETSRVPEVADAQAGAIRSPAARNRAVIAAEKRAESLGIKKPAAKPAGRNRQPVATS